MCGGVSTTVPNITPLVRVSCVCVYVGGGGCTARVTTCSPPCPLTCWWVIGEPRALRPFTCWPPPSPSPPPSLRLRSHLVSEEGV